MLGPGSVTTHLADLGADVIKVEPPTGDYIRQMTWPIVDGVSLMHLHISRGKRSIVLDLRTPEGADVFRDLVRNADVVIEAMRPGGLARRGLGYEQLREVNPKIVFCTITGYGMTGPYKDLPSHGIAYDAWAGIAQPQTWRRRSVRDDRSRVDGHQRRAAVRRLRHPRRRRSAPGRPAKAPGSRSPSPTPRQQWTGFVARRSSRTSVPTTRSPATSPTTTSAASRRSPGCAAASATSSTSRPTATSCSCRPSASSGRTSARASAGRISSRRTRARSTPTTPAATPSSRRNWPRSSARARPRSGSSSAARSTRRSHRPTRRSRWPTTRSSRRGCGGCPARRSAPSRSRTPVKFIDEELPVPTMAPTVGEHTDAVLRDVLGYDDDQVGRATRRRRARQGRRRVAPRASAS